MMTKRSFSVNYYLKLYLRSFQTIKTEKNNTYIHKHRSRKVQPSVYPYIKDRRGRTELRSALPSHYICEWWRWVRSQPYLYISGTARLAFGSAFSLWPQRPGRGWTGPSCRGSHGGREEEEERGSIQVEEWQTDRQTAQRKEKASETFGFSSSHSTAGPSQRRRPFARPPALRQKLPEHSCANQRQSFPSVSRCSSATHLFIKSHRSTDCR